MIFISVDLPAPFSPSTAWISPGNTVRSMASLATTDGYILVMPESRRRGSAAIRLPRSGTGTSRGLRSGAFANGQHFRRHGHGDRARLLASDRRRAAYRHGNARERFWRKAAFRELVRELCAFGGRADHADIAPVAPCK